MKIFITFLLLHILFLSSYSQINDSSPESATQDYITLYQNYISNIRGHDCQMYPSCSNFGLKVFSETDFISAFVMTSDRLVRCGHDHANYQLTFRENGFKFIDYPAYETPPSDILYKRNSYFFAYSDNVDDDSVLVFIKKLINNQFHQEALLEILRLEFQTDTFNLELFLNKIICLRATGNYELALFEYETKVPEAFKHDTELLYQIALIQYKLVNFKQALNFSTTAFASCKEPVFQPKIIALNGLLYANELNWLEAKNQYSLLAQFESYKHISEANLMITESALNLKYKSPFLATAISILPGAGYAYTGHTQTAISAFLVNGLLAYATYSNFKNKNYGMGVLTSIFNLSFYIGNVYGANKSAKRYNEMQNRSVINKLEFNTTF